MAQQGNLTLQRFVIEEEMLEEDSDRIDDCAKEAFRHSMKIQMTDTSKEEKLSNHHSQATFDKSYSSESPEIHESQSQGSSCELKPQSDSNFDTNKPKSKDECSRPL